MKNKIAYLATSILCIALGVMGTVAVYKKLPQETTIKTETNNKNNVTITETNTIKTAIDEIYDAVVVVETYKNNAIYSTGTGFIYKEDDNNGYLITNHHVIENGNKFIITLSDGEETEATLLGSDQYSDIAVLKIPKEAVKKVAKLGESANMEIGDTVFTVGSPMGKEYMGTVTKGILSGKNRTVKITSGNSSLMLEVLQTDAAINPGNSGGPLVNIKGEVIGVNSMKLVEDRIEGMGFAIPIEIVTTLIDKLEIGQKIERPLIGIEMADIENAFYLYRQGIIIPEDVEQGVVVVKVNDNYPAAKAGLKKGDIILSINETQIEDSTHFKYLLYKYNIGDEITIKYYRDKKIHETKLKLDKKAE
jgi:serine protease Do